MSLQRRCSTAGQGLEDLAVFFSVLGLGLEYRNPSRPTTSSTEAPNSLTMSYLIKQSSVCWNLPDNQVQIGTLYMSVFCAFACLLVCV